LDHEQRSNRLHSHTPEEAYSQAPCASRARHGRIVIAVDDLDSIDRIGGVDRE
jgi:hypothetical protein